MEEQKGKKKGKRKTNLRMRCNNYFLIIPPRLGFYKSKLSFVVSTPLNTFQQLNLVLKTAIHFFCSDDEQKKTDRDIRKRQESTKLLVLGGGGDFKKQQL